MADPKCPTCNVVGIDHIVSSLSKQEARNASFHVAYCDRCGHVYGILAKTVITQDVHENRKQAMIKALGG